MKRTITHEYNELEEKLAASVAAMNFRFMNLCVKAEEMSLIPIRVRVEGSNQNLENVAMIGKKDDYKSQGKDGQSSVHEGESVADFGIDNARNQKSCYHYHRRAAQRIESTSELYQLVTLVATAAETVKHRVYDSV